MTESAAKLVAQPTQVQGQGGRMKAELGGVVVLDFGGQYTQLIARRIREQQVFSAILPCTAPIEEIKKLEPAGIVMSGGPSSVYDVLGTDRYGVMLWKPSRIGLTSAVVMVRVLK
ncbi:MAG TPA: hypothetical protein VM709_11270, partial [Candidatus Sulfotelmatobacter sp.]|nr:hypothetical protein [Candidatus Sulfotelmatobacter sp.]